MKKSKSTEFFHKIYKICDEIIADCGVTEHMTDYYLACCSDFLYEDKDFKKINKKYNLDNRFDRLTPVALIALYVLDNREIDS